MAMITPPAVIDSVMAALENGITHATLVKLILGKYSGADPELLMITVRPVMIRGQTLVALEYRYRTRDIVKNLPVSAAIAAIRILLGTDFKSGQLFTTTEDIHVAFSRCNKVTLHQGPATFPNAPSLAHDRTKKRRIDTGRPFLRALGITGNNGQILPSMSHKWNQINVFLDHFHRAFAASPLTRADRVIDVVDFGAGKGYLTFAVNDYFHNTPGIKARVTGVESRNDLVHAGNALAGKMNCTDLHFCRGDVATFCPSSIDIMIALHACDTATDIAIHRGIRAGAAVIMCAPCCHKELRPQITIPPLLHPVLRFGVHLGTEAEMVTDSLRALWLEIAGYTPQIFEFISSEHTDKNRMILGVKRTLSLPAPPILARINALKNFYGITRHTLEELLRADGLPGEPRSIPVRD